MGKVCFVYTVYCLFSFIHRLQMQIFVPYHSQYTQQAYAQQK